MAEDDETAKEATRDTKVAEPAQQQLSNDQLFDLAFSPNVVERERFEQVAEYADNVWGAPMSDREPHVDGAPDARPPFRLDNTR